MAGFNADHVVASLKRPFEHDLAFAESYRLRSREDEEVLVSIEVHTPATASRACSPYKRRLLSPFAPRSMLAQPTCTMSSSFPSFMSVYDSEEGNRYQHATQMNTEQSKVDQGHTPRYAHDSFDHSNVTSHPTSRPIQRRGSITSSISYSTESSPTTTSSTFDSPLVHEMPGSPSSSPESASSAAPPKSFQSMMRIPDSQIHRLAPDSLRPPVGHDLPLLSPSFPDKAEKNIKNLTLDMRLPTLLRPATSAGHETYSQPFSAPTSPLRNGGRRKPTNLSIRTPGFNQLNFPRGTGLVPPTPSHTALLHQPLASPAFPALASPTAGPAGGMQLSLPNIAQHFNRDAFSTNAGSIASVANNLPSLREDEYQPPQSQEAPERGYTEGPVKIYDEGVYLYLEPTAEEASKFDIVINCAKEIKDPFESKENRSDTIMALWRTHMSNRNSISEPQTAMSEISFKSAIEWPSSNSPETPTATTPKAESQLWTPEYLHVPWDHNSEILGDLYPLCQIIDDRIKKGKKVLIHCQLGVSRSASLIIAYGLYKGYQSNFHSMYMAVKERSRWVGPNMTLIYQLNDYCSKCQNGEYPRQAKSANLAWFIHGPDAARTPTAAPMAVFDKPQELTSKASISSMTPRPPLRLNKELPPVPPFAPESSPPNAALSSLRLRGTPSPTSSPAPPSRLPPAPPSSEPSQPVKRSASRPLPLRERSHYASPMAIPPHRPRLAVGPSVLRPSLLMDLAQQDVPASPSLFSPRATEFVAQPFGVATAGDLATSAPKRRRPPPGAFPGGNEWRQSLRQSMDLSQDIAKLLAHDPRSPHHSIETREIVRHIDDVL